MAIRKHPSHTAEAPDSAPGSQGGHRSHKVGDYGGLGRPFEAELERLQYLAQGLNPATQRWLAEIGIEPGWRCLEVGAAEGSMSRWLAERVGPTGRVVAADLDTRFLRDLDIDNVEVRQLDIRDEALAPDSFELAYCRTILLHLPDPGGALRNMAGALSPGGWLFAEEPDMCLFVAADPDHPHAALFQDFHARSYGHFRATKRMDVHLGRSLPALFADAGLEEIHWDATASRVGGCSATAENLVRNMKRNLGPLLLGDGMVTQDELDTILGLYRDPSFEFLSGLQFAVRGRKPR